MPRSTRRGKAVCFTLDYDALELLPHLRPNSKAFGLLVSELIRAEAVRRETRKEERAKLVELLRQAETL